MVYKLYHPRALNEARGQFHRSTCDCFISMKINSHFFNINCCLVIGLRTAAARLSRHDPTRTQTADGGGGFLMLPVFDGNRLTPKRCRDGGGLGQLAQHVLYQLALRQHSRLQPFLLWFIVCRTNVNCFHHWQLCERSDVPSLTPCLPLNVPLCPSAILTMPAVLLTPPLAHLSTLRLRCT